MQHHSEYQTTKMRIVGCDKKDSQISYVTFGAYWEWDKDCPFKVGFSQNFLLFAVFVILFLPSLDSFVGISFLSPNNEWNDNAMGLISW